MSGPLINSWKDTLRQAYLDGRANVFLLHGAVGDFQWAGETAGFVSLASAVSELLGRSRDFVVRVDGSGDAVLDASVPAASVRSAFSWARPGTGSPSEVLQGNPIALLAALGRLLRAPAHPCGVIVSQAELLLGPPADPLGRAAVAKVRMWLDAPEIRETNNAAVLIADDPDQISAALAHHPRLCRVEVGLPAASVRVAALRGELGDRVAGVDDDVLAGGSRGHSLVQVAATCSRLGSASPEELARLFPSRPVEPKETVALSAPEPAPSSDVESTDA